MSTRQFAACVALAVPLAAFTATVCMGQLPATTVQLPTFGVAIDAAGVLTVKSFEDPGGVLAAQRMQAARAKLPGGLAAASRCRKISLVHLEAALRRRLDEGNPPDDAMRYLAGLTRLEYVFFYPDRGDIVIAGPAEGFAEDLSGRVCGLATGRPVLQLEDLAVALRAFPPGGQSRPFLGCTIDPTEEGLSRFQEFQRTVPHVVPQAQRQSVGVEIAQRMQQSLGMARIRVFGISADTHFGRVLVEADYRMKRIGIGLEPPPIRLASYLDLLAASRINKLALQRWWFVPCYDAVTLSGDRLAMHLTGEGVQLLCEEKLIGEDGQLGSGAPSNKASERFALGFTQKYPELAAHSPVYAQLRNLVDLSVAAAFIQQERYAVRAGWKMATLGDEQAVPTRDGQAPQQVACAVNAGWKGNRFLALAGGGVSIRPHQALLPANIHADEDGTLARQREQLGDKAPADGWWWD